MEVESDNSPVERIIRRRLRIRQRSPPPLSRNLRMARCRPRTAQNTSTIRWCSTRPQAAEGMALGRGLGRCRRATKRSKSHIHRALDRPRAKHHTNLSGHIRARKLRDFQSHSLKMVQYPGAPVKHRPGQLSCSVVEPIVLPERKTERNRNG